MRQIASLIGVIKRYVETRSNAATFPHGTDFYLHFKTGI
jgi:hypothetical protein